jgi:hypothetical protein
VTIKVIDRENSKIFLALILFDIKQPRIVKDTCKELTRFKYTFPLLPVEFP